MDPFALQTVAQHINFNGQIAAVFQQHFAVTGGKTLLQIVEQRQIVGPSLCIATAAINIRKFYKELKQFYETNLSTQSTREKEKTRIQI